MASEQELLVEAFEPVLVNSVAVAVAYAPVFGPAVVGLQPAPGLVVVHLVAAGDPPWDLVYPHRSAGHHMELRVA